MSSLEQIKQLRSETGAGIKDVKKALDGAQGDLAKAKELLRKRGLKVAEKKQGREAAEGIIDVYIHPPGKLAAVVVLNCETDFVARNEEFKKLAHELAKQVAAMAPENLEEFLEQAHIADESKKTKDLITEATAKLGEKIEVREFARFEL